MSKKVTVSMSDAEYQISDLNAKAMWGRCRAERFKDKTKYSRKEKYRKDHQYDD